jgi:hypothetical protein
MGPMISATLRGSWVFHIRSTLSSRRPLRPQNCRLPLHLSIPWSLRCLLCFTSKLKQLEFCLERLRSEFCNWQWLTSILNSVGDKKYLREDEDHETLAYNVLMKYGASPALAQKVQVICLGVSYSSEIKDLQYVQSLILRYPELAGKTPSRT